MPALLKVKTALGMGGPTNDDTTHTSPFLMSLLSRPMDWSPWPWWLLYLLDSVTGRDRSLCQLRYLTKPSDIMCVMRSDMSNVRNTSACERFEDHDIISTIQVGFLSWIQSSCQGLPHEFSRQGGRHSHKSPTGRVRAMQRKSLQSQPSAEA